MTLRLPKINKVKLIALLSILMLSVTASTSGVVKAAAPFDVNHNSPGSLYFYTETSKEFALAAYGCEFLTDGGMFKAGIDAANSLVRFNTGSINTPEKMKCVETSTTLTAMQKAQLIAGSKNDSGGLGNMITRANMAILDQRPGSGLVYAEDVINKVLLPDAVYAAGASPAPYFPGSGYELLQPIQSFWGWAVTLSYSFMIIVILIVSLGLMFRARLDGKNQVKLQNAIPGIVMAMVLIPLTYPISGLFIDAITIGTNVIHDFVFNDAGPGGAVYRNDGAGSQGQFDEGRGLYADDWRINFFNARTLVGIGSLQAALENTSACSGGTDPGSTAPDIDCNGLYVSSGVFSAVDGLLGIFGSSFGKLISGIIYLVFTIITIWTSLRIGWKLFKQLLTLVLYPLIFPFIATTLAIPGQGNKLVMETLKRLANASLHFIVTYGMFLLAIVFTAPSFASNMTNGIGVSSYVPPLLNNTFFGNLFLVTGDTITDQSTRAVPTFLILVGVIIYLLIPSTLDKLTAALAPASGTPKFLTDALNEVKYSSDVMLRQAPAFGLNAASRIGSNTVGRVGKYVGSYRETPFSDSVADQYVKGQQESIDELRKNVANRGWLGRQVGKAEIAAATAAASAGANLRGKPDAFAKQAGEGKADLEVEIKLDFTDTAGTNFSIKLDDFRTKMGIGKTIGNVYTPITVSGAIKGSMTIKAKDGAPAPEGYIFIVDRGGTIGKMENDTMVGKADIKIGKTITPVQGNVGRIDGMYFSGAKGAKASLDFNIDMTVGSGGQMVASNWTMAKDNNIDVFIGKSLQDANGIKKSGSFNIRITS